MSMSMSVPSSDASPNPGRPLTVASYVCTAASFAAPAVLAATAVVLGLVAASRGDRAGRTAALVAGVVMVLQTAFFVSWASGVIRLPVQ